MVERLEKFEDGGIGVSPLLGGEMMLWWLFQLCFEESCS